MAVPSLASESLPFMSQPLVELKIEGEIARLTLNRPHKRNALSRELLETLAECISDVSESDSVRLLTIKAAGSAFCAGMDLQEMESRANQTNASSQWQQDTRTYHDVLVKLLQLKIPTVAAVNGPAVAGGFGIALACDLVVASQSAFFSLPEPKRGITAAILIPLLIYRAGISAASHIALSGQNISAEDAHRIGLCQRVVSTTELDEHITELENSVLTGAASSLAVTKERIWSYDGERLLSELADGMQASAAARETADAREGLTAFLEKKKPSWYP